MKCSPKVSPFCLPEPRNHRECTWLLNLQSYRIYGRAISPSPLVSVVVISNVPRHKVHWNFRLLSAELQLFDCLLIGKVLSDKCLGLSAPFASIRASLLFSLSRKCSLICASNTPITGSEPAMGCPAPDLAKSSNISLHLFPLCPGVQRNTPVLSSGRIISVLGYSKVSFELAVILCIALRTALLLVHMSTCMRVPFCVASQICQFSLQNGSVPSHGTVVLLPFLQMYIPAADTFPFWSIYLPDFSIAEHLVCAGLPVFP